MKLYTKTVSKEMLSVLQKLMTDDSLQNFRLVGGTALSLQLGHRKSIDIDLFTDKNDTGFDTDKVAAHVFNEYNFSENNKSALGLFGTIGNIKTDFFNHGHKWLDEPLTIEGIRMASLREIAAMKLHAIAGNGTRLKDFVDIAFLSSRLTTNEMISAYEEKYKNSNPLIALKAMFYYGDIDFKSPIELVNAKFKWKDFEKQLDNMQRHTNKVFPAFGKNSL